MGDIKFDLSETCNLKEEPNLSKEYILSKVSEEMIFEHYGVPIKKGLFCSKLRSDHRPTVGFYKNKKGRLIIKDFGSDFSGDCFTYVMTLFNVSYYLALQIIANDFGLIHRNDLTVNKAKIKYTGTKFEDRQSAIIQIQTREFNSSEIQWWNRYGITIETLKTFKVYPVDCVWLNGNIFWQRLDSNKFVFAYYGGIKDGVEQWRVYFPGNTKYKFISNWKASQIQGVNGLSKVKNNYIIITKSLKDVMALYEFGITAIAPCSENLFVTKNQYIKLKQNFNRIYLLYDLDGPGIRAAKKIKREFPDVKILLTPRKLGYKDFSDLRKGLGYNKTLKLIKEAKEYYGEI